MGNGNSSASVPSKTRRIVLVEANKEMDKAKVEIETIDTPKPKSGEVLIRVSSAAVNPSDYGAFIRPSESAAGKAIALGKEGSGVVVANGGGMMGSSLVGKKVGFIGLKNNQGSWSEFVTCSAQTVFALPDTLPVEDAASFFVNPYTAVGILDTMRTAGSNGLVHTAAASSLGKMMVKLCAKQKVPLVNVVRRQEQADMLKKLGAQYVVVTNKDETEWKSELKDLIEKLKIRVAFDAVAGSMSGDLLDLLPKSGTVFVYGGLSRQPIGNINPMDMIYRKKQIKGWLLTYWLKAGGFLSMLNRLRWASPLVNSGLHQGWSATKFEDVAMEKMWPTFLDMYNKSGFTDRKLRIRFDEGEKSRTDTSPAVDETKATATTEA